MERRKEYYIPKREEFISGFIFEVFLPKSQCWVEMKWSNFINERDRITTIDPEDAFTIKERLNKGLIRKQLTESINMNYDVYQLKGTERMILKNTKKELLDRNYKRFVDGKFTDIN